MARAAEPWTGYEVCEPRSAHDGTLIPAMPGTSPVPPSAATFADTGLHVVGGIRPHYPVTGAHARIGAGSPIALVSPRGDIPEWMHEDHLDVGVPATFSSSPPSLLIVPPAL